MLEQIIKEAEEYKVEFYRKRITTVEKNKASNREKDKVIDHSQFNFLLYFIGVLKFLVQVLPNLPLYVQRLLKY